MTKKLLVFRVGLDTRLLSSSVLYVLSFIIHPTSHAHASQERDIRLHAVTLANRTDAFAYSLSKINDSETLAAGNSQFL